MGSEDVLGIVALVVVSVGLGLIWSTLLASAAMRARFHRRARRSVLDRLEAEGLVPIGCERVGEFHRLWYWNPFPADRGPAFRVVAFDGSGRTVQGWARAWAYPMPGKLRPPELSGRIGLVWDQEPQTDPAPAAPPTDLWDAELDGPFRR